MTTFENNATTTDTAAGLKRLWNTIKGRRSGAYGSLTVREQSAALLHGCRRFTVAEAVAYAGKFADPEGRGYWADVVRHLRTIGA